MVEEPQLQEGPLLGSAQVAGTSPLHVHDAPVGRSRFSMLAWRELEEPLLPEEGRERVLVRAPERVPVEVPVWVSI